MCHLLFFGWCTVIPCSHAGFLQGRVCSMLALPCNWSEDQTERSEQAERASVEEVVFGGRLLCLIGFRWLVLVVLVAFGVSICQYVDFKTYFVFTLPEQIPVWLFLQLAWLNKPARFLLGSVFFGELRSNLVIGNTLDRHLELDHHPAAGLVFDHFFCVSTMIAGFEPGSEAALICSPSQTWIQKSWMLPIFGGGHAKWVFDSFLQPAITWLLLTRVTDLGAEVVFLQRHRLPDRIIECDPVTWHRNFFIFLENHQEFASEDVRSFLGSLLATRTGFRTYLPWHLRAPCYAVLRWSHPVVGHVKMGWKP